MKLMIKKLFRLWNHLSVRLCAYFFLILLVFSVVLILIYTKMFQKSVMDGYRMDDQEKAQRISARVTDFVEEKDTEGFRAYAEMLRTVENKETSDIWIVSSGKEDSPMTKEFTNVDIDSIELQGEFHHVLYSALAGEESFMTGYDDIYDKPVIRVGTPVYNRNKTIIGAVLVISMVENQEGTLTGSVLSIIFSIILSMMIAMAIALFITKSISSPLRDMRQTALKLAKGNYEVKTNINRTDEIGILAKTLNILSSRLLEARKIQEDEEQRRLDFFANVSHELRTPITVMRGYTETLVDDVVKDEEKKRQYYERMLLECKSMERLVQDLLLLSKMQNPDFEVEKEPVNLNQIFEDIYRSASVIAEEKKIKIHVDYNEDNCMMMGDYDRLRQMFLVIIDNSIKFSNMEGNVYINISSGEKLKVEIKDEGIGISPEEMPYIFEKFYKSKLRQNAKGSGLGLMIAKYIAEKHNGTIEVESELEKGTIFKFLFDKMDFEML